MMYAAVSGGPDSMALLHFLSHFGRRKVVVLYFDHGTPFGADSLDFLENYCKEQDHIFIFSRYKGTETSEVSWREARYQFFKSATKDDIPIYQGHQLDDSVENYLLTFFSGRTPSVIPPKNYKDGRLYIRPFSLCTKEEVLSYCSRNLIPYVWDPTNDDNSNERAKVRSLLKAVKKDFHGNAGFSNIKKLLLAQLVTQLEG